MATPTMERQKSTGYRRVANSRMRQDYRSMTVTGTTVSVPGYARPFPEMRPIPRTMPKKTGAKPGAVKQEQKNAYARAKRKQIKRTVSQIFAVVFLCSLMIYRYAMILETNSMIDDLNDQITQLEYDNQYLAAKLESNLELGVLEKYATEELGMMHPDTNQVFYVDVNMQDEAVVEEEAVKGNLQGVPGALMHAICVLK